MLVEPAGHWSVFKQIFFDHWESFKRAHPRYQTVYYDGLVAKMLSCGDPEQMANANATMTGALGRLIAISENYPQLKSDQVFIRLQDELAGTENRIAVSRQDYNTVVGAYNA